MKWTNKCAQQRQENPSKGVLIIKCDNIYMCNAFIDQTYAPHIHTHTHLVHTNHICMYKRIYNMDSDRNGLIDSVLFIVEFTHIAELFVCLGLGKLESSDLLMANDYLLAVLCIRNWPERETHRLLCAPNSRQEIDWNGRSEWGTAVATATIIQWKRHISVLIKTYENTRSKRQEKNNWKKNTEKKIKITDIIERKIRE